MTRHHSNTRRVIKGNAHDNHLLGSSKDETLIGLGGDDTLLGGSGDDILYGDSTRKKSHSGSHSKHHRPTQHHDYGDDFLFGGSGDDLLFGGKGDDFLSGGSGDDVLYGEEGDDFLWGGSGDDFLFGGKGDDILLGGSGDDVLFGGEGDDILVGDRNDLLFPQNNGFGVSSENSAFSSPQIDILTGGAGINQFMLGDAKGNYYSGGTDNYAQITDFTEGSDNRIQLQGGIDYELEQMSIGSANGVGIVNASSGEVYGLIENVGVSELSISSSSGDLAFIELA